MELSDLSAEHFEKAEFTERRRGYDIDQVERFLEETGTAVAQLLVRHRQLEERAAHAEAKLAAAEERAATAEQQAKAVEQRAATVRSELTPQQAAAARAAEEEEIAQATSTLVMAKRTADSTIAEARAEGNGIISEARASADRIVAEARAEAEAELVEGRSRVMETVNALEQRRDLVAGVVGAFEHRVVDYRDQLRNVAAALEAMVADPEALAPRPSIEVPEEAAGHTETPASSGATPFPDAAEGTSEQPGEPTEAHDVLADAEPWASGTWSAVSTPAEPAPAEAIPAQSVPAEAEETISLSDFDEPATGQTNDRFLRELDEAVNEPKADSNDTMSAFFEPSDEPGRRFGWRR